VIVPYWGEFLVNPAPLELSLNRCSHACSYCFANLNDPHRKVDYPALMRLLSEYRERQTYVAYLLQQGYPTVISNRTDPFSRNNGQQTLAVLGVMAEMGLPVMIQTKGGDEAAEAAAMLPPSVWYVTISSLSEQVRQSVEPGAPTIAARLALIEQVVAAGHQVVVGVNPCVPEWLEDPKSLMLALAQRGARGAWIERLHLYYAQTKEMKGWQREALGGTVIGKAQQRRPDPLEFDFIMAVREIAEDAGLQVYSVGQPTRSEFARPWEDLYKKTFPTAQGFVNQCYDKGWIERLISFDDFADYFVERLPAGRFPIDSFLGSVAHNLWRTHKIPPQLTFRELLGIIWSEPRSRNCPARMPCFAYAGREDGDGWVQYVDEKEMPYLVFSPEGFEGYYADVEVV